MGKLEAKALFYIELNGGFVRLTLRNQCQSPTKWGFFYAQKSELCSSELGIKKAKAAKPLGFDIG